jgi:hypothetical protein
VIEMKTRTDLCGLHRAAVDGSGCRVVLSVGTAMTAKPRPLAEMDGMIISHDPIGAPGWWLS